MDAKLKNELHELLTELDISQNKVSKRIGISPATLSQYMNDSYQGDVSAIEESIRAFIQTETERKRVALCIIPFTPTSVAKKVASIARICMLEKEMGVVVGPAGVGKTESLRDYCRKNRRAMIVESNAACNVMDLFRQIGKELKLEDRGRLHQRFEACSEALKDSGRLLIIDEAEHLPQKALEMVRRLHDMAGIGVLLCGLPRLLHNLRGKRGDFAQLYSRIGVKRELDCITEDDCRAILDKTDTTLIPLLSAFYKGCRTNVRILSKLIRNAKRMAISNGCAINADIVAEAARMLVI